MNARSSLDVLSKYAFGSPGRSRDRLAALVRGAAVPSV
jgi:hypothetical protein